MEQWQKSLRRSISDIRIPAEKFGIDPETLKPVADTFEFRVSPYFFSLIREKDDPIYKQCIPDPRELDFAGELLDDPLGEEINSPVPNIVQRYPDRCLFLVSNQCASYCRFCTRKRKFGSGERIDPDLLEPGFRYIEEHTEVRDVLISGGDPFLLEDSRLEAILKRLHTVKHLDMIRIGTRTPCVLPDRITTKLVRMLKKYHPLYVNVHFNHPAELTEQAKKALTRLADAGIPLGCQTVLLKGVNDDPAVMKQLMHELLKVRVRPYYLFQCDLIRGTEHFRTPLKTGLDIMAALRCHTTGLAVPCFAVDLPGGYGKVALLPEQILGKHENLIPMRNFQGKVVNYPDTDTSFPVKDTNLKE